jgi:uncharacterized protein (TIGR02145 family)
MNKMKKKTRTLFEPCLVIGVAMMMAYGCSKDDKKSNNETNGKTTAVFNTQLDYGKMSDQDGNTYRTIKIGTQTWMAENLRTTKFRNGEAIPEVTDKAAWEALSTGAYCNYGNTNNSDTIGTFGRLYNGYALSDSRNIAPNGWHLPTDEEWSTLITYLGDDTVAGSKLKETDTTHWESPNKGTSNESGFTALPGGYRNVDGTFFSMGYYTQWWSSSEDNSGNTKLRSMVYFSNEIGTGYVDKSFGFSVRCIKDN